MKHYFFPILCSILAPIVCRSQEYQCDCKENLDSLILKTERNYAGFPAKVGEGTKDAYNKLVMETRENAATTEGAKECFHIMEKYVKYFRDRHFGLAYRNPKDFDSTVVKLPWKNIRQALKGDNGNTVLGKYMNPDSTLVVYIVPDGKGNFRALKEYSTIDDFPKGFVYFTLTGHGDRFEVMEYNTFMSTDIPAKLVGNLLHLWDFSVWGRIAPLGMNPDERSELSTWKDYNFGLDFKKLDGETAYLKIPSFTRDDLVERLITGNDSVIRSTKNLIIDLTLNGGGSTGWVYFLPYAMTAPVTQEDTYLRVSPDNLTQALSDLEPFATGPIPEGYEKYFPESTVRAYRKAYSELPETKKDFYPLPGVTFSLDSVTRNPQRVSVIYDDFGGSSTEYFFHLSRQCGKITSYGTNTLGMMDYAGASVPTPLPYENFILKIPTVRSSWTAEHPIDRTGFAPDVPLGQPQAEWVDMVRKDLKMD